MRYAHHERMRAYANILELVARIRTLDSRLQNVARGRTDTPRPDQPDGYPRGGDSTGRYSGTSDPTCAAVEQRAHQADKLRELADNAISGVFEALRILNQAESDAGRALSPPRQTEPEQRPPEAIWCVSCARQRPKDLEQLPTRKAGEAIAFEPRTTMTKRSRDDLCSWCLDRWEGSSEDTSRRKLPDIRLVAWRADNPHRKVTENVERILLGQRHSHAC